MKNIFIATLLISQSTLAFNIEKSRSNSNYYTSETKAQSESEIQQLVQGLRLSLGTSNNIITPEMQASINDEALNNKGNDLSFSNEIKSSITRSANRLSFADKYQAPVLIESTVSISDLKTNKKAYQEMICNIEMSKTADQLTASLISMTIAAHTKQVENQISPAAENKKSEALKKEITDFIKKAPRYKDKDITHLLGELKKIEITDGTVRELHFFRNNLTLEVSFSMLITLRTGMEIYYIQALNCLIDYFNEMIVIH